MTPRRVFHKICSIKPNSERSEDGKPWIPRHRDCQAAKGKTNNIPACTIESKWFRLLFNSASNTIHLPIVHPQAIFKKVIYLKLRFRKGTMTNQENGCYATRCMMCGARIAEDQGYCFDAAIDLCPNCRYRADGAPSLFADSIERFLIGNVL